eukprot:CAMPEP_0172773526 /NCGR_PEP_ID=MMETSP1074-20121228/194436_1 /TAXON_ID=2916 /ORGANISM="Ceratium fusus, Strain PA161109" /LENGTH=95 /DNA_ID=CAMNT_0013609813 /DNA_START=60 /DNA_END=348 /DNA_ORIENTATION=-
MTSSDKMKQHQALVRMVSCLQAGGGGEEARGDPAKLRGNVNSSTAQWGNDTARQQQVKALAANAVTESCWDEWPSLAAKTYCAEGNVALSGAWPI